MTYSDVIKKNLILPQKNKYTISDFKKLVKTGYTQLEARFILICTDIFYNYENKSALPAYFYKEKFTLKCKYNHAI